MEAMKKVIRYQCKFCKKDFKTPDKHRCKFDPLLKNCFTCKYFKSWLERDEWTCVGVGIIRYPNYPDCIKDYADSWNIEIIKDCNYDMQCEGWEEGKYEVANMETVF